MWDWIDQGIAVTDSQNRLKWAYGGDFGEVDHDANFCLNGLCWPHRGLAWPLLPGNLRKVTISMNADSSDASNHTATSDITPSSFRLGSGGGGTLGLGKINVKQSMYWNKYFAEHTYTGGALIERARKDAASMMRAFGGYGGGYSGKAGFNTVDSLADFRKYSVSQHSQGDQSTAGSVNDMLLTRGGRSTSIRSLDSLTMWSPSSSTTNYLTTPATSTANMGGLSAHSGHSQRGTGHSSSGSLNLSVHSNRGDDKKERVGDATLLSTLLWVALLQAALHGPTERGRRRRKERKNLLGTTLATGRTRTTLTTTSCVNCVRRLRCAGMAPVWSERRRPPSHLGHQLCQG